MKKAVFFLLFIVTSMFAHAQLADTARIIVQDGWVEKMDNNIILKVGLNNKYETFSQKVPGTTAKLFPNITTNLSIGLDYRFISASFEFAPDFFPGNGDDDIYGHTKSFSLGFSTIFSQWATAVRYSEVQGYYLQNTIDFEPTWQKGDPYLMLPDAKYKAFFANVGYSFNSNLSIRSLTTFTERQLKSVGSFIPALVLHYYQLRSNPTLKSNNLQATAGPGYFYNFIYNENFFVSVGAQVGLGIVHAKLNWTGDTTNVTVYQNDFAFSWDAKAGIGYNGRSFFIGAYANLSDLYYNQGGQSSAPIENLQAFYQLVIGVRLESPKWVKAQMKKLDDKVKL